MGWLSCLNKGFVWLIGGISVAAVMAAGGFALTATHFFYKRLKKVSKKTLAPTFGPRKLGFLRSGTDPGAAAPVCFAAPPSAVYDCVVRSLRSHARINPSTQPSDVAGGSKARSKALELTLIVEWCGFAALLLLLLLWERACSRKRPDSRPVPCGCTQIQMWERACSRRRPDSRPVPCGCTQIQMWERACSRRRPDSRPVPCGCTQIQMWERACSRKRPDSRPVPCGCTQSQMWKRACSRKRPDSRPVPCGCTPIQL